MDTLCNGVNKPEGSDPIVDPRPPPAKLARLEQNGAGPSAQERSSQGSPVAKNPCLAQKPPTARPQSKSWHSRGTQLDTGFNEKLRDGFLFLLGITLHIEFSFGIKIPLYPICCNHTV